MIWVTLTNLGGGQVNINLDQVVAIEPYEQSGRKGARVRTALPTKNGIPVDFCVEQSPAEIIEQARR